MTAKHNLRHYIDEEKTEYTAKNSQVILWAITAEIDFGGDLDWVPDEELDAYSIREESVMTTRPAIWKFGIDISEAAVIAAMTKGVTGEFNAFLPVRSSFRLEKGQKVGIHNFHRGDASHTAHLLRVPFPLDPCIAHLFLIYIPQGTEELCPKMGSSQMPPL